ncbi:N-acetyltransferase [Corynebacterium suedekumii]|nr:N-acetyltransferase [Corynebacterium suedekumii]
MPSVTNDAAGRRFVILDTNTPTGTVAGSSHYRDRDDERIFFHTEIDEKFSGRGLAGTLTSEALADTAAEAQDHRRRLPLRPQMGLFAFRSA